MSRSPLDTSNEPLLEHKPETRSLLSFLSRLILLCLLPLVILSIYLAASQVRTIQSQRDEDAADHVRNVAKAIDNQIGSQISALLFMADSPLLDDPPKLQEFYNAAGAFRSRFGGHIILADLSMQMLLHTREPFGASLPALPKPQSHAAVPVVMETGRPAVGDMFLGPLANEPLIAVVVPVVRNGKTKYLLLSVVETKQFQQRLSEVSLPNCCSLTLLDGKQEVIASIQRTDSENQLDRNTSRRFTAQSELSHWSVVLNIPGDVYNSPIFTASSALILAIIVTTLVGIIGGRIGSRRLAGSVASLADEQPTKTLRHRITEIEAVREKLLETDKARDVAEAAQRESERQYRSLWEKAPVMMISLDNNARMKFVSDRFCEELGYRRDEVIDKTPFEFQTEKSSHFARTEVFPTFLKTGLVKDAPIQLVKRNGEIIDALLNVTAERDNSGKIIRSRSVFIDITERKRAEEALKSSEERYRLIIESMQDVVYQTDIEGSISFASASVENLLGFTVKELLGTKVSNLYANPESRTLFLNTLITAGTVTDYEAELVKKDGTTVWVSTNARLIRDLNGNPVGVEGVSRDISARREAEELLSDSEERFRLAFENASIGVCLVDLNGRLLKVNDQTCKIFGFSREELERKTVNDIALPEDRALSPRFINKAISGEIERAEFEKRYIHKLGHTIWGRISSSLVRDRNGKPLYFVSHVLDLTERRKAQQAAIESEERYRSLVEMSPDGIAVHVNGELVFVNPAGVRMMGADSPEVLIGKSVKDFVHPDYWKDARRRIEGMLRGETGLYPVESCYVKLDGTAFPVEVMASPFTYQEIPAIQVVSRDITQRKKAEAELERLMAAIEQAAEAIFVTDEQGTIQYVNPAFEKVTGYSRADALGRKPDILKSGLHDETFYRELWNTIKSGEIWSGRITNKKKSGQLYQEETTISPVRDSSDRIVNYVAVKRDITETLELSKQLFQAQKMEAVGTLAGGVAHDFNNILQIVLGYSELLMSEQELSKKCKDDLIKINQAARNGADLVRQLLTFSRKTEIRPLHIDLNTRISQLQKILSRTISKMIQMELILTDDLWYINADPTQVDQVLMNLAVNARDAMPDGGRLVIETKNTKLDEDYAKFHLGAKTGWYVLLSVTDTGQGMDKETLQHIFEPFFTTKGPSEGTGLGLATVYGIVKKHEGYITCYSELGVGTTFNLYFPAVVSEHLSKENISTDIPAGGPEAILLVDDEEIIRELGCRILRAAGYKVYTASNGKEALGLYKARSKEIALVILDLIMPEMAGKECLDGLLNFDGNVKVVVASGYAENGPARSVIEAGAKGFVHKPYDTKQMLTIIRTVLDKVS